MNKKVIKSGYMSLFLMVLWAAFVGNLISYLRALSQVPDGPMPKDGEHQLTWTSAAARSKHGSAWTAWCSKPHNSSSERERDKDQK